MTKDESLREVPHRERPRRDPDAHNSPGGRANTPQHSAGDYGNERRAASSRLGRRRGRRSPGGRCKPANRPEPSR